MDSDPVFSCKPTVGEIEAENFALICVRFTPGNAGKKKVSTQKKYAVCVHSILVLLSFFILLMWEGL